MQISEVVNSMVDLITYSRETGTGPMGDFSFFCVLLISDGRKNFDINFIVGSNRLID